MIWALWLGEEERERIIKRKGPLERMRHILSSSSVLRRLCLQNRKKKKPSLHFSSSSPRLTFISSSPCPSHLRFIRTHGHSSFLPCPASPPVKRALPPPTLWLFSPHTPICPCLALPRWYLIAVKQETGEQTAGEPTLILSCAICCSHMTELQTRSNTMKPHHTWHIDQSWPKSKTESERRLSSTN